MYLLDTNICIALLNKNSTVVAKFNHFFSQCYLSTIIISELYKGVYCSKQVEKNLETLAQFTELLPVEPFDLDAAVGLNNLTSIPGSLAVLRLAPTLIQASTAKFALNPKKEQISLSAIR